MSFIMISLCIARVICVGREDSDDTMSDRVDDRKLDDIAVDVDDPKLSVFGDRELESLEVDVVSEELTEDWLIGDVLVGVGLDRSVITACFDVEEVETGF